MIAPAIRLFLALTVLTGVVYPLVVTGLSQAFWSRAANGSIVEEAGKPVGSDLLAQPFKDPKFFQSRPSASDPAYATIPSGASNLGPTSEKQQKAVAERAADLRGRLGTAGPLPPDLLTASGSGLDPHISPEAARQQIESVARARGYDLPRTQRLRDLVENTIEGPQFGVLGEPRVNVLRLNLALAAL